MTIDLFIAPSLLMPSMSSVTIAQIAKAAGVSTATVDRVLNDRAGVNPETARRVKEVLAGLGGAVLQPGRPKTTPNYRFAFVLPNARTAFFDGVDRIVAQSAGEFRHQHITELTLRLPAHDQMQNDRHGDQTESGQK